MQRNSIEFDKLKISYQLGNVEILKQMQETRPFIPFDEVVIDFLNNVSKVILSDPAAKAYPDVITFGFWIRKASVLQQKEKHYRQQEKIFKIGKGIVFHIAPSNVPVNYAYSAVAGLIAGNANILRIPSKDFPQIEIINHAFSQVLEQYEMLKQYILFVRYGHDKVVNDALSAIADVRVIWGGDATIEDLRKSPMKPRATEVTFADRYSFTVIDAEVYLNIEDKEKIVNDFYNDTFLMDQNACTSPRVVVWIGERKQEAKEQFWKMLHDFVSEKYQIQSVQVINKLTSMYLVASDHIGVKKVPSVDNLVVRIQVEKLDAELMNYKENSGYFFEYDCEDILELKNFCNDSRCQTLSYIGGSECFILLLQAGIKGIDRIVPVGKTMDFELNWDGYNLLEEFVRNIQIL